MEMKELTDADIKAWKPVSRDDERRDMRERGLVCRGPSKTWCFWYWNAESRRKRRLTLGRYPAISLAAARDLVREHKVAIARDKADPAALKQVAKHAASVPKTVTEALALYIERKRLMGRRAWEDDKWNGQKHILPVWEKRSLKDIKLSNVVALLNDVASKEHRGRPTKGIAANRVYSLLSGLFRFAVRQAWIDHNPMADAAPPIDEQPREFTLPGDQVRKIWQVVNTLEDARVRDFYRLTFLTCGRRNEILGMRWDEVDLDSGVWVVPGGRTKNKHPWRVPLTGEAFSLLHERKAVSTSEYVLAGKGGKSDGLLKTQWLNVHHHRLLKRLDAAEINYRSGDLELRGHDIRSLCASQLGEWGIAEAVIDAVLAHSRRGITRKFYNHHDYFAEHARALIRWENWLNAIEQRGEVVRLAS